MLLLHKQLRNQVFNQTRNDIQHYRYYLLSSACRSSSRCAASWPLPSLSATGLRDQAAWLVGACLAEQSGHLQVPVCRRRDQGAAVPVHPVQSHLVRQAQGRNHRAGRRGSLPSGSSGGQAHMATNRGKLQLAISIWANCGDEHAPTRTYTHTHTHIEAHARMRTYTLALRASSPAVCTTRTQTKAQYEHTCAEDNSTTQAPTTDSQTHAQLLEGGMRRGARMTGGGAAWADKRCPSERGRPLSGGDLGREALSGGVREGGGHCQGEPWG